jgi:hypothetical protein
MDIPDAKPLRVLVFAPHVSAAVRFFDEVFRILLEHGHEIDIVLDTIKEEDPDALLAELLQTGRVRWRTSGGFRGDQRLQLVRRVRSSADYVRFLGPRFARSPWLIERAARRAPRYVRFLVTLPGIRSPRALRLLYRSYLALEANIPTSDAVDDLLRSLDPDVVLICPNLMPGSEHTAYVKSARNLGLPTAISVPSWDNLVTKQEIRPVPDAVLVWNEIQRDQASLMHSIPEERIFVTGAQCFDRWFDWQPRDRAEFCRRAGLDPSSPFLLYTCGSLARGPSEAEFVREWASRIRSSPDPRLRGVGILVRPHPHFLAGFETVDLSDLGVVVWTHGGRTMPLRSDDRGDYYDSLFHSAAVVGINTSAMFEAAILGRPVHSLLVPEFSASQEGVLHFEHVRNIAHVAETMDEHLDRLREVVVNELELGATELEFAHRFVRPHGVSQPASPIFVAALEELASRKPTLQALSRRSRPLAERGFVVARLIVIAVVAMLVGVVRLRSYARRTWRWFAFQLLRTRLKLRLEYGRFRRSLGGR